MLGMSLDPFCLTLMIIFCRKLVVLHTVQMIMRFCQIFKLPNIFWRSLYVAFLLRQTIYVYGTEKTLLIRSPKHKKRNISDIDEPVKIKKYLPFWETLIWPGRDSNLGPPMCRRTLYHWAITASQNRVWCYDIHKHVVEDRHNAD